MTDLPPNVQRSIGIENFVGSGNLDTEINVPELAVDLPNATYSADDFPGLIYDPMSPDVDATILVFRTGKLICTGASSESVARAALDEFHSDLRETGIDFEQAELRVQNIVGVVDFQQRLNLNAAAVGLGLERVEYEPEQFPGLVYRPENADVVCLLFGSGSMVVTGAQEEEDIHETAGDVFSKLDSLGLV